MGNGSVTLTKPIARILRLAQAQPAYRMRWNLFASDRTIDAVPSVEADSTR